MTNQQTVSWHKATAVRKSGVVSFLCGALVAGTGSEHAGEKFFYEQAVSRWGLISERPGIIDRDLVDEVRVEELTKALKVSRETLASLIKITRQSLSSWERGGKIRPANYQRFKNLEEFSQRLISAIKEVPLFWERELLENGLTVMESFQKDQSTQEILEMLLRKRKTVDDQKSTLKSMFGNRYYGTTGA